jgi:hypothetical protein
MEKFPFIGKKILLKFGNFTGEFHADLIAFVVLVIVENLLSSKNYNLQAKYCYLKCIFFEPINS